MLDSKIQSMTPGEALQDAPIADMSPHLSTVLHDDGLPQSLQQLARHSSGGVNVRTILFRLQSGSQHPTDPTARFDDDNRTSLALHGKGCHDPRRSRPVDADVGVNLLGRNER